MDPQVQAAIDAAIAQYKQMGAELVDVSLPHTEYGIAAYYIIEPFSKSRAEGFGPEVQRRIMIGTYALSSGYYDAYYVRALKMKALIKRDFAEAFKKCDVIACPTSPV